jgi:uridine phosphorylase
VNVEIPGTGQQQKGEAMSDNPFEDTRRREGEDLWRDPAWDAVPGKQQMNTGLRDGDVGRYVFLPGDPDRCALIAEHLDNAKRVAQKREFVTYTGTLLGEEVSVTSTGIGCPSATIAVEELAAIGADTFIRVGTSGAVNPRCAKNDLVVATAAVRDEGTTSYYVPIEFPAVADPDVMRALAQAARTIGARYHVGIVHTKDGLYGQRAYYRMPTEEWLRSRWQAWVRAGVLCTEMEAAGIFIVSNILGKRAGAIMVVGSNQTIDQGSVASETPCSLVELIGAAVEAVKMLIEQDRTRGR